MGRRLQLAVAWLGFCGLIVLHVDSWRGPSQVFRVGWIPDELGYRLAWVLLAWLYLLFVCAVVWRREPGRGGRE